VPLKQPTREFDAPDQHVRWAEAHLFPPIWSCSVWGLPCRLHRCLRGALLPHLFTLTIVADGGIVSVALAVSKP